MLASLFLNYCPFCRSKRNENCPQPVFQKEPLLPFCCICSQSWKATLLFNLKTFFPLFPLRWLFHYRKHQKFVCARGILREEVSLDWWDLYGGWPDDLIPCSHLSLLCWLWRNSCSCSNQDGSQKRVARLAGVQHSWPQSHFLNVSSQAFKGLRELSAQESK